MACTSWADGEVVSAVRIWSNWRHTHTGIKIWVFVDVLMFMMRNVCDGSGML